MARQLHLIQNIFNKTSLKDVKKSFWIYVLFGQIVVFVVITMFEFFLALKSNYDIVVFKGLSNFGLYSLAILPAQYVVLKLGTVLLVNIFLLTLSYRISKFVGKRFLNAMLFFIVISNFGVLLYW